MRITQERLDYLIKIFNDNNISREEIAELRDNIPMKKYGFKNVNDSLGNKVLPMTVKFLRDNTTYSSYENLHWFERNQLMRNKTKYKYLLHKIAVNGLTALKALTEDGFVLADFEMNCNHSRQEERTNVEIIEAGIFGEDGEILNSYVKPKHDLYLRTISLFNIVQSTVDQGISQEELLDKLYIIAKKNTIITFGDYDATIIGYMKYIDNSKVDYILSRIFDISPLIALILNITIPDVSRRQAERDLVCRLKYYHQLKGNVSLFYLNLLTGVKPHNSHKAIDDARNLLKILVELFKSIGFTDDRVFFSPLDTTYSHKFINETIMENNYELSLGKLTNKSLNDGDKVFDEILEIQKKSGKDFTLKEEIDFYNKITKEMEEAEIRRRAEESRRNLYYDDILTLGDIEPDCVPPNWFFD